MGDFKLSVRSLKELRRVHPDMIRVAVLGLQLSPIDFMVTEGARTIERQHRLMVDGFSQTIDSKHLIQKDGFAHAFDLMAVGDLDKNGVVDHQDKSITWNREWYTVIAEKGIIPAAKTLGIEVRWGGHFKSFFDGPHFEMIG